MRKMTHHISMKLFQCGIVQTAQILLWNMTKLRLEKLHSRVCRLKCKGNCYTRMQTNPRQMMASDPVKIIEIEEAKEQV